MNEKVKELLRLLVGAGFAGVWGLIMLALFPTIPVANNPGVTFGVFLFILIGWYSAPKLFPALKKAPQKESKK